MIGDYLDKYTFQYLMQSALSNVPSNVDKREGSIIYDALAPACYELTAYYIRLKQIFQNTFAKTSSGDFLALRAAEQNVFRLQETKSLVKGEFKDNDGNPKEIAIGARFSSISSQNPINFIVESEYEENNVVVAGYYLLRCEEYGSVGNGHYGNIVPLDFIQGLAIARIVQLVIPAQDTESDESLRDRYFLSLTNKSFGGNIAQYREELKKIDGVGDVQIYPIWQRRGDIIISVLDVDYNIITDSFKEQLQEIIDPIEYDEDGIPVYASNGKGLGLAPIGHFVKIVKPTEYIVNIQTTLTLQNHLSIDDVQAGVERVIEEYLLSLRKVWAVGDEFNNYSLSIFIARINAAILSVDGVLNIANTIINNVPGAGDIILQENYGLQELPVLGEVILNES